ncbi:MAG: histidine phosphatase family protein [Prevotellaceae bacterium]|jgi:hypothetical protein|nr:histidine phosphatase family protein [Prevotellaceae bacterium]
MKKLKLLGFGVALLLTGIAPLRGQTSREEILATIEKSGGFYYAYPDKDIPPQTPPPAGYAPFYISHYGRHGSRYLTRASNYAKLLELFNRADSKKLLTPLGASVHERVRKVCANADGREGSLSRLGEQQHRGIAERMMRSYPEVFATEGGAPTITARSTIVPRCILSMAAFCERMKELNPQLHILRDANNLYMKYLNPSEDSIAGLSADIKKKRRHFADKLRYDRLLCSLFTDTSTVSDLMPPAQFLGDMFYLTSDMQDTESDISFYDIFEPEELFQLWQSRNYYWYLTLGPSPQHGSVARRDAIPQLKNIVASANSVIAAKGRGADLRFGHDTNVMPLAALLHLRNCFTPVADADSVLKVWSDFKVVPMGGNIQLVFYRKNGSDDVLVKFLHLERETLVPPVQSDMLPYYHWRDVEKFYATLIN